MTPFYSGSINENNKRFSQKRMIEVSPRWATPTLNNVWNSFDTKEVLWTVGLEGQFLCKRTCPSKVWWKKTYIVMFLIVIAQNNIDFSFLDIRAPSKVNIKSKGQGETSICNSELRGRENMTRPLHVILPAVRVLQSDFCSLHEIE